MSEAEASSNDGEDKKQKALELLEGIVHRMGATATFDAVDSPEGGISIAMRLSEELPGLQTGKRTHLLESLQFLMNKMVNRQPQGRRWIALGLGGHPPPRPAPGARSVAEPTVNVENGTAPILAAPALRPRRAPATVAPVLGALGAPVQGDEAKMEVTPDPQMTRLAIDLAEKSARLGRIYAIRPMTSEDRARMLQAVKATEGVTLKVEGEARNRRLIFLPHKPTPMPKKQFPLDDDDFEDEDDSND